MFAALSVMNVNALVNVPSMTVGAMMTANAESPPAKRYAMSFRHPLVIPCLTRMSAMMTGSANAGYSFSRIAEARTNPPER